MISSATQPVVAGPLKGSVVGSANERHDPPRRGVPLSLLLGVTISALVVLLLGALTTLQLRREERREITAREALLAQSLVPLAQEVEQADSLGEIEQVLSSCRLGEIALGRSGYNVVFRDDRGRVLVSADASEPASLPDDSLQASVAVRSNVLSAGGGTLAAWQDTSSLAKEMMLRRKVAWFDIAITGLAVIVVIQLAVYFLVTRPMNRLLTAIDRFEQGYPAKFRNGAVARELRWLGWRFHRMNTSLTDNARWLVAAHRRAVETSKLRRNKRVDPLPFDPLDLDRAEAAAGNEIMRRCLRDRCVLLEGYGPGSPAARDIALEIWERDAVDAERFGEMALRARLENAALKVFDPEAFDGVSRGLDSMVAAQATWCDATEAAIISALSADGVQYVAIQRRAKHVAGVWRKMQEKHLALEDVQDLFAFRIILPGQDECYLALDTVHRLFDPEPFRFKDYIANPKANGYQSLHTSVLDRGGFAFEIQIRTVDMHRAAEEGAAAHWRYRAGKSLRNRAWARYAGVGGLGALIRRRRG